MPVEVKKALAQALASEANDTASSNGGYVVQKQVKQKILQAQQAKCSNLQKISNLGSVVIKIYLDKVQILWEGYKIWKKIPYLT